MWYSSYLDENLKAKIQSYRTGATSRQRRRRVKEKEKRIQTLFDRFNAGNISLEEYLGAIKVTDTVRSYRSTAHAHGRLSMDFELTRLVQSSVYFF